MRQTYVVLIFTCCFLKSVSMLNIADEFNNKDNDGADFDVTIETSIEEPSISDDCYTYDYTNPVQSILAHNFDLKYNSRMLCISTRF